MFGQSPSSVHLQRVLLPLLLAAPPLACAYVPATLRHPPTLCRALVRAPVAPPSAALLDGPAPAPPPVASEPAASEAAPQAALGEFIPQVLKPSKIQRGDYVIHKSYGIGRFDGLFQREEITMTWDDDGNEIEYRKKYLRVKFRDGHLEILLKDRHDIKLFKRKAEEEMEGVDVRLDGLRSQKSWEKRKLKATSGVFAVAADLLRMYAERQNLTRTPCGKDGPEYQAFAERFTFEPTPDQHLCFEAIRKDMMDSTRPMDRLICGDVGFGKTEVAMRAVYRAVANGRQVAFLAPTTVLAAQHLRVLRARMPDLRIELLSGLVKRTPTQLAELRENITSGAVQVAVGTHSLLSDKVSFGNLGLLIVDEEQRFGVKQKEKIKGAATNVDVLSLSATPIPRTFYMCAIGIRDMSLLSTPPTGRLKVETIVKQRSDADMLAAIRRELARGGQARATATAPPAHRPPCTPPRPWGRTPGWGEAGGEEAYEETRETEPRPAGIADLIFFVLISDGLSITAPRPAQPAQQLPLPGPCSLEPPAC